MLLLKHTGHKCSRVVQGRIGTPSVNVCSLQSHRDPEFPTVLSVKLKESHVIILELYYTITSIIMNWSSTQYRSPFTVLIQAWRYTIQLLSKFKCCLNIVRNAAKRWTAATRAMHDMYRFLSKPRHWKG